MSRASDSFEENDWYKKEVIENNKNTSDKNRWDLNLRQSWLSQSRALQEQIFDIYD